MLRYYLSDAGRYNLNKSSFLFVLICTVAFAAGIYFTVDFNRSMGEYMTMPGGWKMSMMWMQMLGETWLSSANGFLFMWFAMMIAMMMPSALPTFLKTQRRLFSLCLIASGYFFVWLIAGLVVYIIGFTINNTAMRSALLSHTMPLLSGSLLIISGAIQLTQWKLKRLMLCRSAFGCANCLPTEKSFLLGCKQGIACCACCCALMTMQLVLGIMNPLVMILISVIITAEKLFAKPVLIAKLAGASAIVVGIVIIIPWII